MICPKCGGFKEFDVWLPRLPGEVGGGYPCPECQGSGIVSCCDTAGAATQASAEENWQDWVNSQLAGTTRKDETALYARIVELEKRVGELERK